MYNNAIIKLNILKDLTLSFINVKHQEQIREALVQEEMILEEAVKTAQSLEDLGVGSDSATFTASFRIGIWTAIERNEFDW